MRAITRACAVAGLLLAATGLAPAASAAPTVAVPAAVDACGGDGYGGGLPCEVAVTTLQPVCDGDVPRLRYAVTATGVETVDITFVGPDGADVVHTGQPLSGTVLWPGAVVDAVGAPVDWPGWRQEDGAWVAGDEYDWVRPSVEVAFAIGDRSASTVAAYPDSAPGCDPERSDVLVAVDDPVAAPPAERAEVLSATGSTSGPLVLISAGLVLAGVGGVMLARGRRARHDV